MVLHDCCSFSLLEEIIYVVSTDVGELDTWGAGSVIWLHCRLLYSPEPILCREISQKLDFANTSTVVQGCACFNDVPTHLWFVHEVPTAGVQASEMITIHFKQF